MKNKDCIFCKIARGEIPTEKIYEDDKCVVIPDKFPVTKGQSLIISKEHIDYIFDLDDNSYSHLFLIAKKIGKATDSALNSIRTWTLVQGLEVPHSHIKLFPIYKDKRFSLDEGSGSETSDDELKKIVKKIKEHL